MIITDREQLKEIYNWNNQATKTVAEHKAFIDGMEAMMELVDKKLKAEKEL